MVLCWQPSITPSWSASQPPGTQQNSSALLDVGPQRAQQLVVAGELPVAVQLHDAAHLPVGGGLAEVLRCAQRAGSTRKLIKPSSRVAQAELHLAHDFGQVAEQEGGGLLVIPDVGARAVAAAAVCRRSPPSRRSARPRCGSRSGVRSVLRLNSAASLTVGGQVAVAEGAHEGARSSASSSARRGAMRSAASQASANWRGVVVADAGRCARSTAVLAVAGLRASRCSGWGSARPAGR